MYLKSCCSYWLFGCGILIIVIVAAITNIALLLQFSYLVYNSLDD
jgi:hypothetical protein